MSLYPLQVHPDQQNMPLYPLQVHAQSLDGQSVEAHKAIFFFQHLLRNDICRIIAWIFRQIQIMCVFRKIFDVVLFYNPWHRPLLAQPGPWREAIHCALLSSFICPSILIATCLLLAASLAAGVIRPTLAKVHMACALTAHVDMRRRYCPTIVPRRCSDSGLPEGL